MFLQTSRVSPLVVGGFLLFVFALPFDTIPMIKGKETSLTLAVGYLFFALALTQPGLSFAWPHRAILWFAAYLGILIVAGIPHLREYGKSIPVVVFSQTQMVVMSWVACNLLRNDRLATWAINTFAAAGIIIAGLMFLGIGSQEILSYSGSVRRSVIGYNPNMLGSVFGISAVILVHRAFITGHRVSRIVRLTMLPAVALLLVGVANTGSRGAMLATGAGLGGYLFVAGPTRAKLRATVGVIVLGTLLVSAICMTDVARTRWHTVIETGTIQARETLYRNQVAMIRERPLLGWGPEVNTRELGRREGWSRNDPLDAHNLVMHVLTQVGLVGGIPFLLGVGWAVRTAWGARRGSRGVLPFTLISVVLVASMAANNSRFKFFWLILAYALASGGPSFAFRRATAPGHAAGEPCTALPAR